MINNTKYRTIYILPLFCILIFFILKSVYRPADDYAGYYFGSKFFLQKLFDAPTIYETYAFNQKIYAEGYANILACYTPFPPITSLFFLPFTFFDLCTSKLIFNSLSALLFLFSLVRLIKFLTLPNWIYLLIPLVFFIPIRNTVFFGQAYLILFALIAEGFIFYKKEKHLYASLLWGLAIVFKIFPLICLLFLLFKKEWKQIKYLTIVVVLLLSISFFFNGLEVWKTYLTEIFPRVSNGELNSPFAAEYQSMFMLLKKAFVYDSLQNPFPLFDSPQFFLFNFLFKVIVLSFCAFVSLNKKTEDIKSLGIWVLGSILISPNGSTYSLVLLLIPFLSIIQMEYNNLFKGILILILLLINNLPVHLFFSLPVLLQFPRLYLMISVFIFLIYRYTTTINYSVLLVFFVLFAIVSIPAVYAKNNDDSTYLFSKNKYAITYDYLIKDNKLIVYYYSDFKGAESDTIDFKQSVNPSADVYLKNNQIYLENKKLTNTNDRKMKPVLLYSGLLLYLSDKNRGVGFYTLRVKKVI